MIRLFGTSDSSFNSNGDRILSPLKCIIYESDNAGEDYSVDMELPLSYQADVTENRLVVIDTPNKGDQVFRIYDVEKRKNKLVVDLLHVTSDLKNYLVRDSFVEQKNGNTAVNHLHNAADGIKNVSSPFTVSSDITRINSYRCVRTSLFEAYKTVAERWQGHWWRDNWTFSILDEIGQDNGVTIAYRKNLSELTYEEDWSDVVTRLLPVGSNEIMLNTNPATGETKPNVDPYLYASGVSYPIPYTKTVTFTQELDQEDYPDETAYRTALIADLRAQAESYLETNKIPKINYTLKADIDNITGIGDTIVVRDERLGLDITTQVISYKYDYILGRFKELEFGNFKKNLGSLISAISTNTINQVDKTYGQQIGTISSDVSGLSGDVSTLSGEVSGLSGEVSGLSGDVSTLSGTVAGMINAYAYVSRTDSSAAQSFTTTATKVTSLTGGVSHSDFFSVASSQITIKKAGRYLIFAEFHPTAGSSATTFTLALRSSNDNGYILRGAQYAAASSLVSICAAGVVARTANDVISVYLSGNGSLASNANSASRDKLFIVRLSD